MRIIKWSSVWLLTLLFVVPSWAQRKGPSEDEMERFRAKKISFLTDKLQLTPEEAEKFWPIYHQSEEENWEAQFKRQQIEFQVQKEDRNLTDKEIIALTKEMVETHKAEALVREKYNEKFLKVLPPRKVLILYQAEHQFLRQMLHDFRNRRLERD
jgi:Spy/CpxP family protein refolding chaperone